MIKETHKLKVEYQNTNGYNKNKLTILAKLGLNIIIINEFHLNN